MQRTLKTIFLASCTLLTGILTAQVKAPPQPLTGPGGSGYPYGVVQTGPYQANQGPEFFYYLFTPTGLAPTPSNPHPLPTPSVAPVVFFLQRLSVSSPENYLFWIEHIARMGFSVVFATWNTGVYPIEYSRAAAFDFKTALNKLAGPRLVAPMMNGSGNPITIFVGHAEGGYLAYLLASTTASTHLTPPVAIFAAELNQSSMPPFDPSRIGANTIAITVAGDQDAVNSPCFAANIWTHLPQIAPLFRPFLLVRSDSHGAPAQIGNDLFPLSLTTKDTDPPPVAVDDRDFNVTYKLSVAAAQCAVSGAACDYALGNGPQNPYGATTQTDMGLWSDGTPVRPMVLLSNPHLYFGCN